MSECLLHLMCCYKINYLERSQILKSGFIQLFAFFSPNDTFEYVIYLISETCQDFLFSCTQTTLSYLHITTSRTFDVLM